MHIPSDKAFSYISLQAHEAAPQGQGFLPLSMLSQFFDNDSFLRSKQSLYYLRLPQSQAESYLGRVAVGR
jgi:hypothetical protein